MNQSQEIDCISPQEVTVVSENPHVHHHHTESQEYQDLESDISAHDTIVHNEPWPEGHNMQYQDFDTISGGHSSFSQGSVVWTPRMSYRRSMAHPWQEAMIYDVNSDVSSANTSFESVSSRFVTPPPSSADLHFIYTQWISPLKDQLNDIQLQLNSMQQGKAHWPEDSKSDQYSNTSATSSSKQVSLNPPSTSSKETDVSIESTEKEAEAQKGVCLGYPSKPKFCEWIHTIKASDVERAESNSDSYASLAKKLFSLVFCKELSERPEKVCCTKSKGRDLLDQVKLRGVRLHVHRKYLSKNGIKFRSVEEEKYWANTLKKLNALVRYYRSKNKSVSDKADSLLGLDFPED